MRRLGLWEHLDHWKNWTMEDSDHWKAWLAKYRLPTGIYKFQHPDGPFNYTVGLDDRAPHSALVVVCFTSGTWYDADASGWDDLASELLIIKRTCENIPPT
ncbi:Piso0_004979 [Millerozyma farinosa CBS 7064]|uniref:Piso0_004979 protein n=1 Tax=Pichia sorbitophila (strain ATCC MYA-4447 / BCRC 22081 / CBS 7064 / NBRC 10061 / NRRL Y-12695) TaxID=559304 RepID=G8Y3W6_PICSO|nr:Piso0_004979 [Millerozyma farinosa CBS 7064]